MKFVVRGVIAMGLLVAAVAGAAETKPSGSYAEQIAAQRDARVARLTTADGWLTLIGLHFLNNGENTVGSAKDNQIVLAEGPGHVGTVTLGPEGKLTMVLAPEADARIDGQAVRTAELRLGGADKPTLVTAGTVSFFAIDRGGKKALRVKDSAADRRTHFLGLDYFPTDASWRIEARWVPFEKARMIPITNILGQTGPALVPGKAVFEHDGKTYELLPIDDGPGEPLFFVISDATTGKETYGGSRFVYADLPKDGKVVLDFNLAQNPPCAFTPFATCPLPPPENRLPFAVTAGEKNYRGGHE